jgi:hypothetical protein
MVIASLTGSQWNCTEVITAGKCSVPKRQNGKECEGREGTH